MSYTPIKQEVRTDTDIIGNILGLPRLKDESLSTYRKRLLGETTERSGASQKELIATLSRRVGKFDLPVFDIDVIRDSNGEPLATNPKVEITSSHLYCYANADSTPIVTINFYDRADGMFLLDIVAAFSGNTYFTLTTLSDYSTYLKSQNLRFDSSLNYVNNEILLDSVQNNLKNSLIVDIFPTNPQLFKTEVNSLASVTDIGKYYVDYTNGVIFTYESMGGLIGYTYNKFPFRVFWQPLKIYPYIDEDKKFFHRESIIDDDTGLESYDILNSKGVNIANLVYGVHPIHWGK